MIGYSAIRSAWAKALLILALAAGIAPFSLRYARATTHQHVPDEYVHYIRTELLPGVQARCRVQQRPPSPGYGYFDTSEDVEIITAATDSDCRTWERGTSVDGAVRYIDRDANGAYTADEPVFLDQLADHLYNHDTDIVLHGDPTDAEDGAQSRSTGLFFFDGDGDSEYTQGETLWFDTTQLHDEILGIHERTTNLIPLFVETSTPLADTVPFPLSMWDEEDLLEFLGLPEDGRLDAPVCESVISDPDELLPWMQQHRQLLNALTRVEVSDVEVQPNGDSNDLYEVIATRIKAARGLDNYDPEHPDDAAEQPPDFWDDEEGEPEVDLTFVELKEALASEMHNFVDNGVYEGGVDYPNSSSLPDTVKTCRDLFAFVKSNLKRTITVPGATVNFREFFYDESDWPCDPGWGDFENAQEFNDILGAFEESRDIYYANYSFYGWEFEYDPGYTGWIGTGSWIATSVVLPDVELEWFECTAATRVVTAIASGMTGYDYSFHTAGISRVALHNTKFFARYEAWYPRHRENWYPSCFWDPSDSCSGTYVNTAFAYENTDFPDGEGVYVKLDEIIDYSSDASTQSRTITNLPDWPPPWPENGPNGADVCSEDWPQADGGPYTERFDFVSRGHTLDDYFALHNWQFQDPAGPLGTVDVDFQPNPSVPDPRTYEAYFQRYGDPGNLVRVRTVTGDNAPHSFNDPEHCLEDIRDCVVYADFSGDDAPDFVVDEVPATTGNFPDVNRDDLVDVGADLEAWGEDSGTMHFELLRGGVQTVIPLGVESRHCLPVHAYIAQAGSATFENTWWQPPEQESSTPLRLAFSLHTRVRNIFLDTGADTEVKRVQVTRPRGNVVVFQFDWDAENNRFSPFGRPVDSPGATGNASRTYVLVDNTPANNSDLDYELRFQSGITHHFAPTDGSIAKVSHRDGRTHAVSTDTCEGVVITSHFTRAESPRYECTLQWSNGRLDAVEYTSRLDPDESISVNITYGNDQLIKALEKSIPQLNRSTPDPANTAQPNTIEFGSGTALERSEAPGPIVTFTTTVPDALLGRNSVHEEYELNDYGLPTRRTRTLGNHSAQWTWEYNSETGFYPDNGVPQWSKVIQAESPSPMGYWERFEYKPDNGWLDKHITPFKDAEVNSPEDECVVNQYFYDAHAGEPEEPLTSAYAGRPTRIDTHTIGTHTARVFKAYSAHTPDPPIVAGVTTHVCGSPDGDWGDPDTFCYSFVWNEYGPPNRTSPTSSTTYESSFDDLDFTVVQITHLGETTTTVFNPFGFLKSSVTKYGDDGIVIAEATASDHGAWGWPGRINYLDGTSEEFTDYGWHGGPGVTTERDASTTTRTYTDTGLLDVTTSYGVSTDRDYNAAGHVEKTIITEGQTTLTSTTTRDALGRVTRSKAANAPAATSITYDSQPRTRIIDPPESGTIVQKYYRDGRMKEVSGTAGADPADYNYGVDHPEDLVYADVTRNVDDDTTVTHRTRVTPWGAVHSRLRRQGNGDFESVHTVTEFDPQGRARQWQDADLVPTSVTYNGRHQLASVTSHGVTTSFVDDYTTYDGKDVHRVQTTVGTTTTTVEAQYTAVDGTKVWNDYCGRVAETTISRQYTPQTPGKRIVTTTYPDNTSTVLEQNLRLPVSVTRKSTTGDSIAGTVFSGMDYLGSTGAAASLADLDKKVSFRRTLGGTTATHTISGPGDVSETIDITTDSRMRLTTVGFEEDVQRSITYHDNNAVASVEGIDLLPRRCEATPQGKMKSLQTYTDHLEGEQHALTEWDRDHTGLTAGKTVEDRQFEFVERTAAGRIDVVRYPYRDENGDLAEIVTDYDYRDDGTLEQVTYTHGDDDITVGVTLDDHGRLKTMGELTFDYEPDDSIDTVQTVFTDGAEETVLVDRRYDDKGRFTGLSVQLDGVQVNNYSWHYHEHDGRLETVTWGDAEPITARYGYADLEDRLATIAVEKGGAVLLRTSLDADYQNRPADTHVILHPDTDAHTVTREQITEYFPRGKRKKAAVALYNPDAPATPDIKYKTYSYDGFGQLSSAEAFEDAGRSAKLRECSPEYTANAAGAMTTSGVPKQDKSAPKRFAEVNPQNECGKVESDGEVIISGVAHSDATITVACEDGTGTKYYPATRAGQHYSARVQIDNTGGAAAARVTVTAVRHDPATGEDVISEKVGAIRVPAATATVNHHSPGALTSDGEFLYTWTPRLRLASVTPIDPVEGDIKREYRYDALGRRVQQKTLTYQNNDWALSETRRYVFDGFLPLAEYLVNGTATTLARTYVWGPDLSGDHGGAGGIGGLLAVLVHTGPGAGAYLPAADSRGNIRAYMRLLPDNTAQVAATLEYSPFGITVGQWYHSNDAEDALHGAPRFSTKLFDSETGLYYFGYRHYRPETHRWLSRDPLGEAGGLNLYAFCANDPVNHVDPLGLCGDTYCTYGPTLDPGLAEIVREEQLKYNLNPDAVEAAQQYSCQKALAEILNDVDVGSRLGSNADQRARKASRREAREATDLRNAMLLDQMSNGQTDYLGTVASIATDILERDLTESQRKQKQEYAAIVFDAVMFAAEAPRMMETVGILGERLGIGFGRLSARLRNWRQTRSVAPKSGTTRFVEGAKVKSHGKVIAEGTVDVKPTLDRIQAGKSFPHRNDGSIFRNREGLLPKKPDGYYQEFVHPTPGVKGPGPQRIIKGQGGELYYTPDHYESFVPLNPGG